MATETNPPGTADAPRGPTQTSAPEPVTTGTARGPVVANPTPRPGEVRVPSGRELARLRKERFGEGPGSIQIDVDPRGGRVDLVYTDGAGRELSRESFDPGGPAPPPTGSPEALAAARSAPPAPASSPIRDRTPAPEAREAEPESETRAKKK